MDTSTDLRSTPTFRRRWRGYDCTQVQRYVEQARQEQTAAAPDDPHELLDRAKELAAQVVEEAHQRAAAITEAADAHAATVRGEAEAEAAVPGTESPVATREPDEDTDWGALTDQIMAVLATSEQQAQARLVHAETEAATIVAAATEEASRIRVQAAAEAASVVDAARSDLSYARAHRDGAVTKAAEIIDAAEAAAAQRWHEADRHLHALGAERLQRTAMHVASLRADVRATLEDLTALDALLAKNPAGAAPAPSLMAISEVDTAPRESDVEGDAESNDGWRASTTP